LEVASHGPWLGSVSVQFVTMEGIAIRLARSLRPFGSLAPPTMGYRRRFRDFNARALARSLPALDKGNSALGPLSIDGLA
jgi:hypothetical protein